MKIMITGARGMLGRTLTRRLTEHQLLGVDISDFDITDPAATRQAVSQFEPEAIIHCAAMTAVDDCQTSQDAAWKVNVNGTANIAEACAAVGARLIAISTDYVFSGESDAPYCEHDTTGPQTVYGMTKMLGEMAVAKYCENSIIVRIAWLYGPGGPSFVHTMLRLAAEGVDPLRVVDDQVGNPTSTEAVADHIKLLLDHPEITGPVHLTCEGHATWCQFAAEILRLSGSDCVPVPCSTDEFPRPAARPANSQLDNLILTKHNIPPMPHWRQALEEFFRENPDG
ncbi:MAG: dTDP-4-dehydrorhamnose reductase [Phycisphaerae bacterium]|jgi:dTDP-4-dehydrorhamnose reductase|nr:dTDP-4-dehydrorhamnose reductase [Phycisphaerae bacterium]MDP7288553.1 dTDP-4-dehydrorhamnose reductase [Phycisphaerae bacterium]